MGLIVLYDHTPRIPGPDTHGAARLGGHGQGSIFKGLGMLDEAAVDPAQNNPASGMALGLRVAGIKRGLHEIHVHVLVRNRWVE